MKSKFDIKSILCGALLGAAVVFTFGAATKQPPAASGDTTAKAKEAQTEHVTGIGGVFFKAKDPKGMVGWYRKDNPNVIGHTEWGIFPTNTTYFGQSSSTLMINYRVANLERMLAQLRQNGVKIDKAEDSDYGRFAWIMDPEGNRIELWEQRSK